MEHTDVVASLKDLSRLHAQGVLSDEEFARAKRQVIASSGPPGASEPRYSFDANVPPAPRGTVQIPAQRNDGLPQNAQWGPLTGSSGLLGQPAPVPPRPQHAGAVVAAIAAVAAGVAFLVLPMISVGPFGATGSRIASLGSLPGGAAYYALWLIPVAAAVVLALAVRQLMEPPLSGPGRKATLIPLIVLATATALAYVAMLVVVQEKLSSAGASSIGVSVLDLAGTGFWVVLGSTVVAAIAGGVELGVNRGLSDWMRRTPNAPPQPVSVGRNVAFVATAVAIVLAMVGVAVWNVRSSPATAAQNLTALEDQSSSSAGGQTWSPGTGNSSGGGTSSGSGNPSGSTSDQGTSPVQAAGTFVQSYYSLLPGDPDAAWAMLSPQAQAASGSQQDFDDFWNGISAVSLENVQTVDPSTVEATIDFTRTDGSWTREDYRFSVSDSRGQQVIQSSSRLKVVSSGGPSEGPSAGSSSAGSSSDGPSTMGIVDVSAVSSDPRAGEIGQALDEYFSGINDRDWSLALGALDPRVVDQSDPNAVARFEHGESTTTDSNVVVQSIQTDPTAPGGESATVTFQSNQDPSLGPDGESCTLWKLDYQFSDAAGVSVYIYKSKGTHTAC